MREGISVKQLCIIIFAALVMFLPRRLMIASSFSYRIIVLFVLFLYGISSGFKYRIPQFLKRPAVILYFAIIIVGFLRTSQIVSGIGYLLDTVFILVFLCSAVRSKHDIVMFWTVFSRVLIIYCLLGIIETFSGFNVFDVISRTDWAATGSLRFGLHRSYGASTTSINNGFFLALCIPPMLYNIENCLSFRRKRLYKIAYILVLINIVCTLSRAPILAAVATHVIVLWKKGIYRFLKQHTKGVLATVFALFVLLMIPSVRNTVAGFFAMFAALFDSNVASSISDSFGGNAEGTGHRLMLFAWVYDTVKDHIWFGLGPNARFSYWWKPENSAARFKESIENQYLQSLYYYGIIGVISNILFFVSSLMFSWKLHKKELSMSHEIGEITFGFMVFASFLMYFVVLFTAGMSDDMRMFYILLAFIEIYGRQLDSDQCITV